MKNDNLDKVKDIKDKKDILDAIKKISALQEQINSPTRDGMINALSDAQSTAGDEIKQIEYSQKEIQYQRHGCVFRIRTCIEN